MIELKNVTFAYERERVLNELNLTVDEGKLVALVGKNGCGKTTLLKLLAGEYTPDFGKVMIQEKDPFYNISIRKNIVYASPTVNFYGKWTIERIVAIYEKIYEKFSTEFAYKVFDIFEIKKNVRLNELSMGQKSIVQFTIGLATRCKISLFDEPVVGLDIGVRKTFYEILLRDYIEYPRTIILSSHMIGEIEEIFEEVIIINQGKVILHEEIEEMTQHIFRVSGEANELENYLKKTNVLYRSQEGIEKYAIVENRKNLLAVEAKKFKKLNFEKLTVSESCMYRLGQCRGEKLECLWEKKNENIG